MDTTPSTSDTILGASEDQPKKFVRTYEGDLEELKKLNLQTFVPPTPSSPQEERAATITPPTPVPPPPPPPPPPQAPEPEPALEPIAVPEPLPEPIREPAPAPEPPPAIPPPIETPLPPPIEPPPPPSMPFQPAFIPQDPAMPRPIFAPEQSPEPPVPPLTYKRSASPLQTYSGDFMERVQKTRASTATVLAAEQDALQGEPRTDVPRARFSPAIVYSIAGAVLFIAGAAGSYYAYRQYAARNVPVIPTATIPTPIVVDERVTVSGRGQALIQALAESASLPLASGTVRFLTIATSTEAASATENILAALRTSAPDALVRNVNAVGSMAGVIMTKSATWQGGRQSIFFILSVAAYNETLAGMLTWEPRILTDLGTLFAPQAPATASTTAASTTVAADGSANASNVRFVDDTVANHDVRIVRDAQGRSLLLYGYWNPTTLVIARDPAAFTDLLGRLANARTRLQ